MKLQLMTIEIIPGGIRVKVRDVDGDADVPSIDIVPADPAWKDKVPKEIIQSVNVARQGILAVVTDYLGSDTPIRAARAALDAADAARRAQAEAEAAAIAARAQADAEVARAEQAKHEAAEAEKKRDEAAIQRVAEEQARDLAVNERDSARSERDAARSEPKVNVSAEVEEP